MALLNWRQPNIIEGQISLALAEEERERAERFKRAWQRYYGQFPKPLKVRKGQPDDNVVINMVRVIVDKGVSFLFGKEVSFELDQTAVTRSEEWLSECWRSNRKTTLLLKLALNGAICGQPLLKLVVGNGPYPRLVVLDPATVTVRWEPDDIEQVVSYVIQYPAVDPRTGKPIVIRQTIEREARTWTIIDQVSSGGGAWQTTATANWPYAWPPIIDCQNLPAPNEYWGISDLEDDLLDLNASINFVLSNLNRIVRFHAHPKTWGKGFAAQQLSIAVDETIVLPSPEATLQNLEMSSDLASAIELYKRLKEALHEVSRVPEIAAGKLDNVGPLSGLALQILYQSLLEKTMTKRRTYGEMLVELNRRLLALGGFGEENITTITWPEPLPRDPLQERQVAVLDRQLGASTSTLLGKLGYDPDIEREKREVDSAELGEQMLDAFDRGEQS